MRCNAGPNSFAPTRPSLDVNAACNSLVDTLDPSLPATQQLTPWVAAESRELCGVTDAPDGLLNKESWIDPNR